MDSQRKTEVFNLGVLAGLVDALDITYDVPTIKKITAKIRAVAQSVINPTPAFKVESDVIVDGQ